MPKVHSHYENLKVARDASADEIRAAYRALTRKHHPDRNPDNADSQRVMSVVNVAYGVLSDPVKRSEHDRWIAQAEAERVEPPLRPMRGKPTVHTPTARYQATEAAQTAAQRARQVRLERRVRRGASHLVRHRVSYGIAGILGVCLIAAGLSALHEPRLMSAIAGVSGPVAPVAPAEPVVAGYVRADVAPNGRPWPTRSGYVEGYPQANKGGLSEVMIDNTQNDTDMFAKLISLDGPSALPVRTFFVAARGRFTLSGLSIGTYDLRYRNLVSGGLLRSPAFILEEVATSRGTEHSTPVMKLYQSGESGMQTYALGDAEF